MSKTSVFKAICRFLLIVFSVIMIYWYFISAIVTVGSVLGTVFFMCTALCGIFSKPLFKLIRKVKSNKTGKIIFSIITVIFAAFILYVVTALGTMTYASMRTPPKNSTLIVLGCQVNGKKPSRMLRTRIEAAYDYLIKNPDTKCIVSGGKGANEGISEAQCMFNELTEKGISPDRIYMEEQSTNTEENIKFSKEIIKRENLNENLAIVTNEFHELRSSIIAHKQGCSSGAVSAKTPTYLLANFATREILALAAEIVF